jgi:hypothetical protein
MLRITATTGVRPEIYDWLFGAVGTPADQLFVYSAIKVTTLGTEGGAVVPDPLDDNDPASLADVGDDFTIEATPTGVQVIRIPVNSRASYRWVAAPGGGILLPATALFGLIFRSESPAAVVSTECTSHWLE